MALITHDNKKITIEFGERPSNSIIHYLRYRGITRYPKHSRSQTQFVYKGKFDSELYQNMVKKFETTVSQPAEVEIRTKSKLVWPNLPDDIKYAKPVRKSNFVRDPSDKKLAAFLADWTVKENWSRPVLNAILFEDNHIVATDSHKLIHLYNLKTFDKANYCITNYCLKKISEDEKTEDGKEIIGQYPEWRSILPTKFSNRAEIDLLKVKTFNEILLRANILNDEYLAIKYFKDDNYIAFAHHLMLTATDTLLKLGWEKAILSWNTASQAAVITRFNKQVTEKNLLNDDFVLLMPMMMIEGYTGPIFSYNLRNNKGHEDGNYEFVIPLNEKLEGRLPDNFIKLAKKATKSSLPIIDNIISVKDKEASFTNLNVMFTMKNVNMEDGLYFIHQNTVLPASMSEIMTDYDPGDYPSFKKDEEYKHIYTFGRDDFNKVFPIAGQIVAKDELRPVMECIHIVRDDNDENIYLFASDATLLIAYQPDIVLMDKNTLSHMNFGPYSALVSEFIKAFPSGSDVEIYCSANIKDANHPLMVKIVYFNIEITIRTDTYKPPPFLDVLPKTNYDRAVSFNHKRFTTFMKEMKAEFKEEEGRLDLIDNNIVNTKGSGSLKNIDVEKIDIGDLQGVYFAGKLDDNTEGSIGLYASLEGIAKVADPKKDIKLLLNNDSKIQYLVTDLSYDTGWRKLEFAPITDMRFPDAETKHKKQPEKKEVDHSMNEVIKRIVGIKHDLSKYDIDKQINLGIKIEMEHTNDTAKAAIIVADHLKENPEYYTEPKPKDWAEKEIKDEAGTVEKPDDKDEIIRMVNEANKMTKQPILPEPSNPNIIALLADQVKYREVTEALPSRCETNVFKFVKKNPDKYYPVGGYFINKNNVPVEHWWVYDSETNEHFEITPNESSSVPKDYIKGYVGVIEPNIKEQIKSADKFSDVEFFLGGTVQYKYFDKLLRTDTKKPDMPEESGSVYGFIAKINKIRNFVPADQIEYLANLRRTEEKQGAIDIVDSLIDTIESMPVTYETENTNKEDKIVHLHYYSPSSNWYIVEKDKGQSDDEEEKAGLIPGKQYQAFGYAVLNGDWQNAELGFISIDELINTPGVELDFHWVNFETLGNVIDRKEDYSAPAGIADEGKPDKREFLFDPKNKEGKALLEALADRKIYAIAGSSENINVINLRYRDEKYRIFDNSGEFKVDKLEEPSKGYLGEVYFKEGDKERSIPELAETIKDVILIGSKKIRVAVPDEIIALIDNLNTELPFDKAQVWNNGITDDEGNTIVASRNRVVPAIGKTLWQIALSYPAHTPVNMQGTQNPFEWAGEDLKTAITKDGLENGIIFDFEPINEIPIDEDADADLDDITEEVNEMFEGATTEEVNQAEEIEHKKGDEIIDKNGVDYNVDRVVDGVPIAIKDRRKYGKDSFTWISYYDKNLNEWINMGDPFPKFNPSNEDIKKWVPLFEPNIPASKEQVEQIYNIGDWAVNEDNENVKIIGVEGHSDNDIRYRIEYENGKTFRQWQAKLSPIMEKEDKIDLSGYVGKTISYKNIYGNGYPSKVLDVLPGNRLLLETLDDKTKIRLKVTEGTEIWEYEDEQDKKPKVTDFKVGDKVTYTSEKFGKTIEGKIIEINGFDIKVKFEEIIPGLFTKKDQVLRAAMLRKIDEAPKDLQWYKNELEKVEKLLSKSSFTGVGMEEKAEQLRAKIKELSGAEYENEKLLTSLGVGAKQNPLKSKIEKLNNVVEKFRKTGNINLIPDIHQKKNELSLSKGEIAEHKGWVKNVEYAINYADTIIEQTKKEEGGIVDTEVDITKEYANPFEINKAIEKLLDSKWDDPRDSYTDDELEFIMQYSGYGGLDKYGEISIKSLFEFYTPERVIEKMWGLAFKYGYDNGPVLEPSVGTGRFFDRRFVSNLVQKTGYEINKYSAKICKLLFPEANINNGEDSMFFEQAFIENNYTVRGKVKPAYDLIIGNPPYGAVGGRFMGMGEKSYTKASNYIEYFILRGLDLLNDNGLLIYIIGAETGAGGKPFLDQGITRTKEMIKERGKLIDAYRLPSGIFERTDVVSDIIVIQKREKL